MVVAAARATLEAIREPGFHQRLARLTERLASGLENAAREAGTKVTVNRIASLLTVFFRAGPVSTYRDVRGSDADAFAAFFHALLEEGIYIPPSAYECWFVSAAHTEEDIDRTVQAAARAFRRAAERKGE